MDGFELSEQKGRALFSGYCNTQEWCKLNRYSTTKFASYDASYYSGDTRIIGEIKYRNYPSYAFDDWYLKESKIRGLQRMKKITDSKLSPDEKECEIQYILFFSDGVVQIWNITNIDLEQKPISTLVTNTTMGDNRLVNRNQYMVNNLTVILKDKYNG